MILAGLADQNEGEFKVVGEPFTEEPYGIGLTLDDTDFRMWINDVLEEAYEDGTLGGGLELDGRHRAAVRRPAGGRPLLIDPDAPGRVAPARGIRPLTHLTLTRGGPWSSSGR